MSRRAENWKSIIKSVVSGQRMTTNTQNGGVSKSLLTHHSDRDRERDILHNWVHKLLHYSFMRA